MPVLKNLNCSIELSPSERILREFGTTYADGRVETYISVPSKPQSFCVHLTSDSFIAEGLAMYVFIDGIYQCNRNRQGLKLRKELDKKSLVDFKVRQKEERKADGSMVAREWRFDGTSTVAENTAKSESPLGNLGCIEVVVLRCAGTRDKEVAAMNLDGTAEYSDHESPRHRSQWIEGGSAFDDRNAIFGAFGGTKRPPPPPPFPIYRSPYAETVYTNDNTRLPHTRQDDHRGNRYSDVVHYPAHGRTLSRISEPISPKGRPLSSVPSDAFQYGSGPVPAGHMFGSQNVRPASAIVANAPGIDPAWLNDVLTKAVKRGVEESRLQDRSTADNSPQTQTLETSSQLPGAWPTSPFGSWEQVESPASAAKDREADQTTVWGGSLAGWRSKSPHGRANSHVAWDEDSDSDSASEAEGWRAPDETPTDSWDTDQTWENKRRNRKASRASNAKTTPTRSHSHSQPKSHRNDISSRSRNSQSRKSRSKSRSRKSSWNKAAGSPSADGWTHTNARLASLALPEDSDDTLEPSQSRSQIHTPQSRYASRRSSHRSKHTSTSERKPSRRSWEGISGHGRSEITTPADFTTHPAVSSAPLRGGFGDPTTAAPAMSQFDIMNGMPEKSRRKSYTIASMPPAPFANPSPSENRAKGDSTSSSSWDIKKRNQATKHIDAILTWGGGKDDKNFENSWKDSGNGGFGWKQRTPPSQEKSDWGPPKDSKGWSNGWKTDKKPKPSDDEDDTWDESKPYSYSWNNITPLPKRRYTSKSLSKYRRHRSSPADSPPAATKQPTPKTGIATSILSTPSTPYDHAISRPTYLDTLESPYAVFKFHYRTRAALRKMFGDEVPEHGRLSIATPEGNGRDERERLKGLERGELVEEVVGLRRRLDGKEKSGKKTEKVEKGLESEGGTEEAARGWTEKWLEAQRKVMGGGTGEKDVGKKDWF